MVLNNKVWIPVEATLVGKPFFSAWKQGALKYNEMKAENYVNEISVKDSNKNETLIFSEKVIIATGSVPTSLPGIDFDEKKEIMGLLN